MNDTINLIEIFSSIQGEGILAGVRQIFIRLPQCNLSCKYCDTEIRRSELCNVESTPGSADYISINNPVPFSYIIKLLNEWNSRHHHSISITGGEPLLHTDTLSILLPEIRKILPVYLETNGTLPDELSNIIDLIDYVSMDIKLESASGIVTPWDAHRLFVSEAHGTNLTVKVVVNSYTTTTEISKAAAITAETRADIPFIIQPETTAITERRASARLLLSLYETASQKLSNVRIIPQQHQLLGFL